jgi:hypothetical protein
VGPRARLDESGKSRHYLDPIPGPPTRSQSLYRLRYTREYLLNFTYFKTVCLFLPDTRRLRTFVTWHTRINQCVAVVESEAEVILLHFRIS